MMNDNLVFAMKQLYNFIFRMTFQRWVICLSFIVCHSSFSSVEAQTFTQRIQNVKDFGTISIHHDKAIDDLVNGPSAAATIAKKQTVEKASAKAEKVTTSGEKAVAAAVATAKQDTKAAVDTLPKKTGRTFKTTGYRVQVFAGGNSRKDKQSAERIGNELRVLFPNEPVYVHFHSPRWICRIGNFRTQEEAHQMLENVKKLGYSASTIIRGKITLQY